ncbi:hypothetical protein AB2M62_13955 [Sphingomonas sp. MMS12-HWE2-04]|uniref:hypothetical protein n=1 Tax=Sphingomonas sp. MMS12-HWE2-04 TaxID=3234199 RepID=UPI00384CBB41
MNFFDRIHETQITRTARQPKPRLGIPFHRRLFAVDQSQRVIARAAAVEVLG